VDDDATFSRFFDSWIFSDNSATTHHWNFDLARDEYWLPFPPDVVGILYPMAPVDDRDNRIYWDEYVDCRVGGGGVNTFGGAEIV